MAELKTQPHEGDVDAFLDRIENERQRNDARTVRRLMAEVTGEEATMWGPSMVGFGGYHYRYASGREGEWFKVGFAPRKQNLTLYMMSGFDGYEQLLERLGKHRTGKSCLYIRRLEDIDVEVLCKLVASSVEHIDATYPSDG